jgi:hypothetical protein
MHSCIKSAKLNLHLWCSDLQCDSCPQTFTDDVSISHKQFYERANLPICYRYNVGSKSLWNEIVAQQADLASLTYAWKSIHLVHVNRNQQLKSQLKHETLQQGKVNGKKCSSPAEETLTTALLLWVDTARKRAHNLLRFVCWEVCGSDHG